MKRYIFVLVLILGGLSLFTSCRNDELDPESIFIDPEYDGPDPTAYSFLFDRWLFDNYLIPYNLQFRYRLEDVGTDMNYNVIPTSYEKSIDMAVLVKYLWFDVYAKVVREDFLKEFGPRIIHLIGSAQFNPANGTLVLGSAEGGLKVTLTQCNELSLENMDFANEHFFKTMHHEFGHILHQRIPLPRDFRLLSPNFYEPFSWQERSKEEAWSLGFVSPYASAAPEEDFVETIAVYIVSTDAQWNHILTMASIQLDPDVNGRELIETKLDMCKRWLRGEWNVELDALRDEVQIRQANIPIDSLRRQLTDNYPLD
ncbi:MAG: putative zinc-binding metallopeptidase [Dysgonamonadaceae bacterium]|nr:putative zinc-binding metallopeptidase [Dysgonamonadaceae bacterium]